MNLYHYYDKRSGPFRSVTAVDIEEGRNILEEEYIWKREELENAK